MSGASGLDQPYLYKQSVRLGALFMLCSSLVFSFAGILVKTLSAELPLTMMVFFRNAGGLLVIVPWMLLQPRFSLRTEHVWSHALRAAAGVTAMYCFFFTITRMPLAEAISLNFTSPLIIPMMGYFLLKEKIPARIGVILGVGFVGVLLIMKPGAEVFNPAALVGVISAFFASFALVNVRKLTRTEPALRVVFYFALLGSLITLAPMLFFWQAPTPRQWLMLLGVGFFATGGQYLLTRGYASGPVGQVGFFHYSAVIFAGLVDWLIWSEIPDALSLGGVGLICAAGIFAMQKKSK
ncbi:MAG: DMT family transporter [Kiritimatiellia bacterium]